MRTSTLAGVVTGAALAGASDVAVSRLPPRYRNSLVAAGLIVAAAIYPLARHQKSPRAAVVRELAAMGAFGTAALVGVRRGGPVLAAGWAAHAAFDMLHDTGDGSRIPRWYPAVCAGYDLAVAAITVTRRDPTSA